MKLYEIDRETYNHLRDDYAMLLSLTFQCKIYRQVIGQSEGYDFYKTLCTLYNDQFYRVRKEDDSIALNPYYKMHDFKDFASEVYKVFCYAYQKLEPGDVKDKIEKIKDAAFVITRLCKVDGNYEEIKAEGTPTIDEDAVKQLQKMIEEDKVVKSSVAFDSMEYFNDLTIEELINIDMTKYSARALVSLLKVNLLKQKEH